MLEGIKKILCGSGNPKIGSTAILEQGGTKTAIRLSEYAVINPLLVTEWFQSKSDGYEFLAFNESGFCVVRFKNDGEATKADFKGFEYIPGINSLDQYFAIKVKGEIYHLVLKESAERDDTSGKTLRHQKKMEKLVLDNPYVCLEKAQDSKVTNGRFVKFISGTDKVYETEIKPITRSFIDCLTYTITGRIPVRIGITEEWLLAINNQIKIDPRDISVSFQRRENLDVYTFHFQTIIDYLFELEKDEKTIIEEVAAALGKDVPVIGVR